MQTFCQLNKPYKGAFLKQWMREVAKRYYSSSPEKHKVPNAADFYFNGTDIVIWMTNYFNTILDHKTYMMVMDDVFHDNKGKVYPKEVKE